jgi:hypothetical protein
MRSSVVQTLAGNRRRRVSAGVWAVIAWMLVAFLDWSARGGTNTSWAFQPVGNPSQPRVKSVGWVKTPIDRFVLARLEAAGREPSPSADKRTLIRRATFDLTGLPPTPEAVEEFLADDSPGAFERVVDRLLRLPEYGERWARHWLDIARYADNKGYVFFEEKTYPWAWTYRDYVVRAFNEDKPYNRFLLEQIAADQLSPTPEARSLAALGFLTVGDHFSNNTHDILDDRIDVVTRGLLGLTVGCARCHDHKYDPVSQADYYALYGVFRSSSEPMVPPLLEAPPVGNPYECFLWELSERERRLREFVESKHRSIVTAARDRIAEYLMAVHAQRGQPTTESFMLLADPGDLNPTVITRWRRFVERDNDTNGVWRLWHRFSELSPTNFAESASAILRASVATPIGGDLTVAGSRRHAGIDAAFAGEPPASMTAVAERYAGVLRRVDAEWKAMVSNAVVAGPSRPVRLPNPDDEALRRVLYGPDAPADIPLQLDWGFLSLLPDRASQGEFQVLLKDLEQWLMNGPHAPPRVMALTDLPVAYEPRIFERGNPGRLGASVPRRFLKVFNGRPFHQGSGRLELAQALVDPQNPLTARVFVNRVWMHHFGVGLVNTPSDFGTRSEPPSHPELLDWLASDFMRNGWQIKRLHRQILLSAAYQQSSRGIEVATAAATSTVGPDPENRLLWRMNRRRHDFEVQRDALLAVSGKLDLRLGGPAISAASQRRTLYSFVNRLDVPPVMTTFDFPSPSASCPQRSATTVPSQALYWMNNDFVADCAAAVVRRPDVTQCRSVSEKVTRLYRLIYSRPPSERDLERARTFLGSEPEEKVWQQLAHALLLANEFVFVD